MIGILPARLATRQRLLLGTLVVAAVNLLSLVPLELGPFGSPWPIGLLWAACGWAGLGANVTTASALFVLGLWADALSGAPFGTWSAVALLTHGITILLLQYVGLANLGKIGNSMVSGAIMLFCLVAVALLRDAKFYLLGAILPIVSAVLIYRFTGNLFELKEDEA